MAWPIVRSGGRPGPGRLLVALLVLLAAALGPAEAQFDCGILPRCATCVAKRVGSITRMFCTSCLAGYAVSSDQRSCICSPGFYWDGASCVPCGIGAWCAGGSDTDKGPRVPCGTNMTTTTSRARYAVQCVPQPGSGLLADGVNAEACPVGFYSYGFIRKPCTPCPRTFTTVGGGASSRWKCACPPGYRYADEAATACGYGSWKAGVDFSTYCRPCGTGLTTPTPTAGSSADCRLAKPGYRLMKDGGGTVTGAAACGAGFYSPGGDLTNCTQCPPGTSTFYTTSDQVSDCMANVGYGQNFTDDTVYICPIGTYKYSLGAYPCSSCGSGLLTDAPGATSYTQCYIPVGYGGSVISYDPITVSVARCTDGTYGVTAPVYGPRAGYTCGKCALHMTTQDTNPSLTTAARAAVINNGSSSCVTSPGYGYDSSSGKPYRCTAGTYSSGYSRAPCAACPANMTTLDTWGALTSAQQAAVLNTGPDSCVTSPGSGFDATTNTSSACAAGTFSLGWSREACQACPSTYTSDTGSTSCWKNCLLVLCGPVPAGWGGLVTGTTLAPVITITQCSGGYYGGASVVSSLARVLGQGSPCTACGAYLTTPDTDPSLNSTARAATLNEGSGACVAQPGAGWASGPVGSLCGAGTYNAGYNQFSCQACTGGTTCPAGSTSASSCV